MDGATGGDVLDVAINVLPMTPFDALLATAALTSTNTPEVPPKPDEDVPCSSTARRLRKSSPTKVVGRRRQLPAEALSPSEEAPMSPSGRSPTRKCVKRKRQRSELILMVTYVFLCRSCVTSV